MPIVSIVIAAYNQGRYLPDALNSVLAQTNPAWEAIIVDDGSTDNTREVTAQFTDPRIRYVFQENHGLSSARNTGILSARGEYLAFLDADDAWKPELLLRCLRALLADGTPAGVHALAHYIDESGNVLPQTVGRPLTKETFRECVLEGGFFPVHAALVRKDAVCRVGLFDTRLSALEDWDLWIRISEKYEMLSIPESLAYYRVHQSSMSTDAALMHANRLSVLSKYFGRPEGDPAVWPEEKRRVYAFAYRASAIGHIQQGQKDQGWRFLASAIRAWPNLLTRLDTSYELICSTQPRGYRGKAHLLDIEGSGAAMLRRLDSILADAGRPAEVLRRPAHGKAYLAMAMLSDQADCWPAARRYLFRAIAADPHLLTSYPVVRRLLKLCAGQKLATIARKMLDGRHRSSGQF